MKKILLLLGVIVLSFHGYGQKKNSTAKKATATTSLFPKIDNLTTEVKNGNFQISISEKGKTNDALVVKAVDASFKPADCKLSSFTANGVKLYLLTWSELTTIVSAKKTEDKTTIYNVIYELTAKKQVFSNYQLTNHITEQVTLGNTTASETQEKYRREGFEFKLNPDGSVTQKNKTQQNIMVYDAAKMEFKKK